MCEIAARMELEKEGGNNARYTCNRSCEVHISNLKHNDGAMHKSITKRLKQAMVIQYTKTRHACAVT